MDFTYIAWGSGEIVARAFGALALISLSPELGGALALAALGALLMGSASAAISGNAAMILNPPRMVIAAVVASGVLLAPVRVIVEDRFDGQDVVWGSHAPTVRGPVVVAGVPAGVALPAAAASRLGLVLTELLETAMGLVDDTERLSSAGLWLEARALQAIVEPRPNRLDTTLAHDFALFLENCTYFELLAGRLNLNLLMRWSPIDTMFAATGGYTSAHAGASGLGSLVPLTCEQAWGGNGDPDPDSGVPGLEARLLHAGQVRKFDACTSLRGTGLALDPAEILFSQSAAETPAVDGASCGTDVFRHALDLSGNSHSVNDAFASAVASELLRDYVHLVPGVRPETLAFGKFAARRQRDASYVIAGELAATALPALRGLLEAAMIVLMPVLLIFGILWFEQMGKYLRNGVLMLLWVHMWPPVMAVINAVGSWMQMLAINEQAIVSNGLLSAASIGPLQDELDVQLAISRYMLVVTPMLAYALVKSGEISTAMLAGKLLMPGEQAAASAAGSAALNNWTADQINLAPRTQLGAAVAQVRDPYGGVAEHYERMSVQQLPSNDPGFLQARQAQSVAQEIRRSSQDAQTTARERSERFSAGVESAYEQALGEEGRDTLAELRSSGVQDKTSFRALASVSESASAAVDAAQALSDDQSVAGNFRIGVGANTDIIPFVDIAGSASEETRSAIATSLSESASQRTAEQTAAVREVGEAIESSGRAEISVSATRISSEAFRAGMRETARSEQSWQEAESRAHTLSEATQASSQQLQAAVHDLLKDPQAYELLAAYHRLRHEDGLAHGHAWSEAQRQSGFRIDIDEVAAQALAAAPAPQPAEAGAALPAGAEQVRADHEASRERLHSEVPPPAGYEPPELEAARIEIAERRNEVEGHEIAPQPQLVKREPQSAPDSKSGGSHQPAKHMVMQAGGRFSESLKQGAKHFPAWMLRSEEQPDDADKSAGGPAGGPEPK